MKAEVELEEAYDAATRRAGFCGVIRDRDVCMKDRGHVEGGDTWHEDDMSGASWLSESGDPLGVGEDRLTPDPIETPVQTIYEDGHDHPIGVDCHAGCPLYQEVRLEQPARDATPAEWRAYAAQEGVENAEKLNRSQIRTRLGIEQPVVEESLEAPAAVGAQATEPVAERESEPEAPDEPVQTPVDFADPAPDGEVDVVEPEGLEASTDGTVDELAVGKVRIIETPLIPSGAPGVIIPEGVFDTASDVRDLVPPGFGWEPFGTNVDNPGPLEFGPAGEGGTPSWERMHVREATEAGPDFCRTCSEDEKDWVPWPCAFVADYRPEFIETPVETEEPAAPGSDLEPASSGDDDVTPVTPIFVTEFEGEYVRVMLGKLPAVELAMPEGYQRGTHLKLELEVRVRNVRYDEIRSGEHKGELARHHVLVLEEAKLLGAYRPEDLDPGVGGSASRLES